MNTTNCRIDKILLPAFEFLLHAIINYLIQSIFFYEFLYVYEISLICRSKFPLASTSNGNKNIPDLNKILHRINAEEFTHTRKMYFLFVCTTYRFVFNKLRDKVGNPFDLRSYRMRDYLVHQAVISSKRKLHEHVSDNTLWHFFMKYNIL